MPLPLDPRSSRREAEADSHSIRRVGSHRVARTVIREHGLANQDGRPSVRPESGEGHERAQNEDERREAG